MKGSRHGRVIGYSTADAIQQNQSQAVATTFDVIGSAAQAT
jgi:hypothetical protein